MEKMNGMSMDVEKENIKKMKELFPNIVTDGKIDFEMLRNILGDEVDTSKEKYQFTWNGKAESIKIAQTPSSATLRPCREKSKDWDNTENLYIEGDNLEVLKQLQKTFYGKIKMIYIDPPYNTGDDFVYKDDFKDSVDNYKEQTNQTRTSNPETSGRFHADWLNMMYPRLLLARNLLAEDGVLFISIDNNEAENLIKIGKEIFGDSNYINALKWKRKKQPSFLSRHIAPVMEFILIFAKNNKSLGKLSIEKVSDSTKKVINISNQQTERHFKAGVQVKGIENGIIPKGVYTIKTMTVEYQSDVVVESGRTVNDVVVAAKFLNTQEKIDEYIENDLLFITANLGLRRYVSADEGAKEKSITDLLLDWGDNQDSEKEQRELFGEKYFEYTKPTQLIYNLIQSCTTKDDIIMDFFSGSATTAHAVMKLNAEDDGNRRFIMVQLPELINEDEPAYKDGYKNICEIGEERIRRASKTIATEWQSRKNGEGFLADKEEYKLDFGFRVFELDSTNINPWDNTKQLDEKTLFDTATIFKSDRSKEDILYEIMLKYGVFDRPTSEVDVNGKIMYRVGRRHMIVCLEDEVDDNDIKGICELQPRVVVFKEDGFKDDNAKINAEYNLKKAGVEDVKCI